MKLTSEADLLGIERCLAALLSALSPDGADAHAGGTSTAASASASASAVLGALAGSVRDFVLSGGKRVRPQLCLWTWRRLSEAAGRPPGHAEQPALTIACAWELFHAFLLVHDDLIDEAETRRGRPSLHRELEAEAALAEKGGRDLALVAGDLLFGLSLRALAEARGLDAEQQRAQMALFSRVALETGFGQAIDIHQAATPLHNACEAAVLRGYHWKTAAYTFEGPMLAGAILAGASDAVRRAISRFALALGQAYQLQNDLIDLAAPAHEGSDLVQGKRTVTLVRGRLAMADAERGRFDRMMDLLPDANGQAVRIAEELRQQLLRAGAPRRTRELIDRFLAEASAAAADAALPGAFGDGLRGVLDVLRQDYFAEAPELLPYA